MCRRTGFDLLHNLGVEPSFNTMLESTVSSAPYTPARYVETYKQVFQDALDNYFKK